MTDPDLLCYRNLEVQSQALASFGTRAHFAVREAQGLRSGGFGLLMAKKLVDELIYSERGNDVLLVKYIDPAASQVA